jgi:hypothetical protein
MIGVIPKKYWPKTLTQPTILPPRKGGPKLLKESYHLLSLAMDESYLEKDGCKNI